VGLIGDTERGGGQGHIRASFLGFGGNKNLGGMGLKGS